MFDQYVAYHARLTPDALAVRLPERDVSYAAFDRDIGRMAALLAEAPIAPGAIVSVALAHDYLHWVMVLALARRGIASSIAADDRADFRVTDDPERALPGRSLIVDRDWLARASAADPATPRIVPQTDAVGIALRTSATTGEAKRVGWTFGRIDAAIRNAQFLYGTARGGWLGLSGHQNIMGCFSMLSCWGQGQMALLGLPCASGQDAVAIAAQRPAYISLVPAQLRWLLDNLPGDVPAWPVRLLTSGGPLPAPLAQRAGERLSRDIVSQYGTTETSGIAAAALATILARPGAAGYAVPGVTIEILDEGGLPLPPGQLGRVQVRSDRVAPGYLDDPERSAECFSPGAYLSNDLGVVEADGLIILHGRADDMMNVGGQKILPRFVEDAALGCPGVLDAAAFGLPDADGAMQCWLAIEADGTAPPDEDALKAALAPVLDWVSVRYVTVDRIPRNAMGKVQRSVLRDAVIAREKLDPQSS